MLHSNDQDGQLALCRAQSVLIQFYFLRQEFFTFCNLFVGAMILRGQQLGDTDHHLIRDLLPHLASYFYLFQLQPDGFSHPDVKVSPPETNQTLQETLTAAKFDDPCDKLVQQENLLGPRHPIVLRRIQIRKDAGRRHLYIMNVFGMCVQKIARGLRWTHLKDFLP